MADRADEKLRADTYEANKDDEAVWASAATGQKKPRRRLGAMVSVRLSPDELDRVRQAATKQGMSVSAFLRSAAVQVTAPPTRSISMNSDPQPDMDWRPVTEIRNLAVAGAVPSTRAS